MTLNRGFLNNRVSPGWMNLGPLNIVGETLPKEFRKNCDLWLDPYRSIKKHFVDVGSMSASLANSVNTFEVGTSESGSEVVVYNGKRAEVGMEGRTSTELLEYGDFDTDSNSDGLADSWHAYNLASYSLTDNIQSFLASASFGRIWGYFTTIVSGHIYYAYASVLATTSSARLRIYNPSHEDVTDYHSGSGNFETLGVIATSDILTFISVQDARTSDWNTIQCAKFKIIDLTTDYPDILDMLCVDPTNPTPAENADLVDWCKTNIPYFSGTVSVDPQSLVSKDADGNTIDTIDLSSIGKLRSVFDTRDTHNSEGTLTRNISEVTAADSGADYGYGTPVEGTNVDYVPLSSGLSGVATMTDTDIDNVVAIYGSDNLRLIEVDPDSWDSTDYDPGDGEESLYFFTKADGKVYFIVHSGDTDPGDFTIDYILATATTSSTGVIIQPIVYDEGQIVLSDDNDLPIPTTHKVPINIQMLENWVTMAQSIQQGADSEADTADPYDDGKSLVFSGAQLLNAEDICDYTGEFFVTHLAYIDAANTLGYLSQRNITDFAHRQYGLAETNGSLTFVSESLTSNYVISTDYRGAWHIISYGFDGTTAYVLVDGTIVGSVAMSAPASQSGADFMIGARWNGASDYSVYFKGKEHLVMAHSFFPGAPYRTKFYNYIDRIAQMRGISL